MNWALMPWLPSALQREVFWDQVPSSLAAAENILRVMVFAMPFLMPLRVDGKKGRGWLLVFAIGMVLYGASWMLLILAPDSAWSRSGVGFLAPAYTPALWLGGLARLGKRMYWGNWYRPWMYILLSGLFLIAHVSHAALVYSRIP